jgi:hypothetical protein
MEASVLHHPTKVQVECGLRSLWLRRSVESPMVWLIECTPPYSPHVSIVARAATRMDAESTAVNLMHPIEELGSNVSELNWTWYRH